MCLQCDVRAVGGMYLNIVVIVVCFVAYTVPFNSCFYLYIAIVKRVVLILLKRYKISIIIIIIIIIGARMYSGSAQQGLNSALHKKSKES